MNTESSITDTLNFNFLKKSLIGGTDAKIILPTIINSSTSSNNFMSNASPIQQDNFSTTSQMEPLTTINSNSSINILKYVFYALLFYLIYSYYMKNFNKKLTPSKNSHSSIITVSPKSVSSNVTVSQKSVSSNVLKK